MPGDSSQVFQMILIFRDNQITKKIVYYWFIPSSNLLYFFLIKRLKRISPVLIYIESDMTWLHQKREELPGLPLSLSKMILSLLYPAEKLKIVTYLISLDGRPFVSSTVLLQSVLVKTLGYRR